MGFTSSEQHNICSQCVTLVRKNSYPVLCFGQLERDNTVNLFDLGLKGEGGLERSELPQSTYLRKICSWMQSYTPALKILCYYRSHFTIKASGTLMLKKLISKEKRSIQLISLIDQSWMMRASTEKTNIKIKEDPGTSMFFKKTNNSSYSYIFLFFFYFYMDPGTLSKI